MKKLFVTLAIVLTGLVGYSQIPKPQSLSNFSTWSITPYGSVLYENTDLETNEPFYTSTDLNIGFGLEVNKQLSHFTSIQVNGFDGVLETEWNKFKVVTDIRQLDLRFRFNITNGPIFRKWRNTQLYAFAGYGVLWFEASKKDEVGSTVLRNKDITRVVPIGIGTKYRISNRLGISADISYIQTNTDVLDTWSNPLTEKDGYTRITVGINYTPGKKKILEWDHPYSYLVPETVYDTTVIIQKIETVYTEPKVVKPDSVTIYYFAGNWQIEEPYLESIDELLIRARTYDYSIEISGYCDSSGTQKGNVELVNKRVDKVLQYAKKYLVEEKITSIKYDEAAAVYAPEARNRKVVIKIIK